MEIAKQRCGPFELASNLQEPEEQEEVWTSMYLERLESQFEGCLQSIYENNFIEDVFPEYSTCITKDAFIDSVEEKDFTEKYLQKYKTKHQANKATATWIFDPKTYRKLTR